MLLAIDMGNTNITLGAFENETLCFQARLATDRQKLADSYAVELGAILRLYGVEPQTVTGAVMCSVVPSLNKIIACAVKRLCGVEVFLVTPYTDTGVKIGIRHPHIIGPDLLVGAVAAVERVGAPCLVWDLGTATTLSVVDKDGVYQGGAIIPGVMTALASLTDRASLLPDISLDTPVSVIGSDTVQCLQSGSVFGTASMVDGMTARTIEALGYDAPVVMTGGIGKEIAPHCRGEVLFVDELLLDGLRRIYERQEKMI